MTLQPPRRSPDNEQRLIVLACLDKLGPCTELQLLQFLTERDTMNYFDMMFSLNALCDGGQAVRTKKRAGYLYELTDAGREALSLFGSRVPGSIKKLLKDSAEEWKRRFRQEMQYQHAIRQTERGEYDLTLTAVEQEMDMLQLRFTLPARDLARRMAEKWPQKAAEIYETVIRLLSEEDE